MEQPCCSGRLSAPAFTWGRCYRRVGFVAKQGFQANARVTAPSNGVSTRADAYAGSLGGMSSSALNATTETASQVEQSQPEVASSSSLLDAYKSHPAVSRPKPLKINIDLALYRARQTRIAATRSTHLSDRSKLLRDSEAVLRRCLELDPTDGRPYVSLGKILVLQRRYKEAAQLYEQGAAATGGTNAFIWTAWALLASRQGNCQLARKLFDAAVVADASHAAAWHGWGMMEKGQGNFTKARDLWVQGIQQTRRRPNPYLYQSLAVLAAEMGVTEEARKWFRLGTDTHMGSSSHALWQAWALMEKRQGDASVVRSLFRRGLAVSPRSRYTFLAWALWEKEQGEYEEARHLFKEGWQLNPRDAAILQAWALMEQELGNPQEARRLFKQGSIADPSHLYVWQAWGVMESRLGELDAARSLFQQGVWSAPPRDKDVSLIFQAWAVLEVGAQNYSMARQLFKCAVKANPQSEPSWLAWADMEDSLGAFDRGKELRSFSLQERQEVVRPAGFTTMPQQGQSPLGQLSNLIAKWFHIGDEAEESDGMDPLEASNPDALSDPFAGLRSMDTPDAVPAPVRAGGRKGQRA